LVALAQPVLAQIPGLPGSKASPPPEQEQVTDPLGRTTPRGTIAAFLRAVERDDFTLAARYMQVTDSQRPNTEALARDLKTLLDRHSGQPVTSISDSPDGALDDGLPIDRERVGPIIIGDRKADVTLVRVTDPDAGPIWLISSETLATVGALSGAVDRTWVERVMPPSLVRSELLGISLAHWVVLAACLVIPFILLALASGVVIFLVRRGVSEPARRRELEAWYAGVRWPTIVVLTLAMQLSAMPFLGFPLGFRMAHERVGLIAGVIALTWLLYRLLTLVLVRARRRVRGMGRSGTLSLMVLGERSLKAFITLVAVFAILSIVGVNTRTALAGVGIGGIALALGAQRTVENFLGGVALLSDRALAVGDLVRVSDRLGWVEDITLRSVRVRTVEQTLMSLPAGALAEAGIENFATRDKILMRTTLPLQYGTTVKQLRAVLDEIRKRLAEDARIEADTARIRLADFGEHAVELELFAYVLTSDVPEFLIVREELLLEIAAIVETSGSGFALPTPSIYLDDAPGGERPRPPAVAGDVVARDGGQSARSIADALANNVGRDRSGTVA
jgi:MscS family membrane protein